MRGFILGIMAGCALFATGVAQARDACPANYQFLITETMRASNIHKDFLENKRDAYPEWHIYWEQTHKDTAEALLMATRGC